MTKRVQIYGVATGTMSGLTGLSREVIVDTTKNTLVVHDGVTVGGHELAKADATNIEAATSSNAGSMSAADKDKLDTLSSSLASVVASAWIETSNAATARTALGLGTAAVLNSGTGASDVVQNSTLTGVLAMWAAAAAPTGWLLCDGSAVSRTDYATLFGIIGTTWGAGNGTTTFNVPDLRGRAPIGVGTGSGLTARALAATGGEETHALNIAELAAHTHAISAASPSATNGTLVCHSDGAAGDGNSITSGSAGSGTAHNNMQPFAAVNFIIKH